MNVASQLMTTENIVAFTDYWNRVLKSLVDLKAASADLKNEDIDKMTDIVCESICAHQDILIASETFKKPVNQDSQTLIKKISSVWGKLPDIYKGKKDINFHGEALKNGLDAIFWLFSDQMCDSVVQTYLEQIDFPGNKILAMKKPEHTKWLNLFKNTIKEMYELVKKNYKNGLNWNLKGETDVSKLLVSIGNTYRKNFKKEDIVVDVQQATINKLFVEMSDENSRKLKPVPKETTKEEKKTEEKKDQSRLSFTKSKEKSNFDKRGRRETLTKKGKQEQYEEGKSSFFFENLVGEQKELSDKLENKSIVQISNCCDCTFKIPKKINAIKITNCENVNIICESLVTMLEVTNSLMINIDVSGIINAFSVDSSSKVYIHVLKESASAQFIVSKSTEAYIRVRHDNDKDNYSEFAIPEQFVFKLNDNKLECKVSDLYS